MKAILLLLAIVCSASAQVSISWIGQACFVVRSSEGAIVTDPPAASIGYRLPVLTADAVTVTHDHPDHNNVAAVTGGPTIVDGRKATARQEVTVKTIPFVLIPGFHDNTNGSQRGPNTMVRWTQGGLRFAHLGDLGQEQLTDAQKADLTNIDVLFVPAGGFFTVSPERAAQYVRELRPRVAILMHYRTALITAQTAGLPDAAAPFPNVQYRPAAVTLQKETLPETTETWVMLPASDATAVNAASFVEAAPVAPGSVVSVFGKFGGSTAAASGFPLATKLGDTEVLVDGKAAPLYYVSPGQVNAQMPSATKVGQVVTEVRVGGQSVGRAPTNVAASAPGLFGAVPGTVKRGEVLSIYGTGIGAVTPAVDDGAAAGASVGIALPNVFLMQRQLTVEYSGLAPGFAGLWQINVRVPADAPTGPDLPLWVVSGTTSNQIKVTVQQ
jgi:uncharacterized protein (TIGR03437 family)